MFNIMHTDNQHVTYICSTYDFCIIYTQPRKKNTRDRYLSMRNDIKSLKKIKKMLTFSVCPHVSFLSSILKKKQQKET